MGGLHAFVDVVIELTALLRSSVVQGLIVAIVGVVFVASGTAKIRRPALAAFALVDFGIWSRAVSTVGLVIGLGEASLGVALLTRQFAPWTQYAAAALLWFFSLLLARELVLGRRHPCYCFGDTGDELNLHTLIRTLALALLATWSLALIKNQEPIELVVAQTVIGVAVFGTIALAGAVVDLREIGQHRHNSAASVGA